MNTTRSLSVVLLLGLAFDAVACGGKTVSNPADPPPADPAPTPGATPEPAPAPAPTPEPEPTPLKPLVFAPCTEPFTGDCAVAQLPLDRNNPSGKTLDVFVTRFANPPNARGSLWLLQGGPGGSISAFEYSLQAYRELYPDLTIYGMEHRGIARSSRLDCNPNRPDRCGASLGAELGAELAFYSTSAAAHDLHELIGLTRKGTEPTFVYGVSYGTYVAQRYLTMFPTEPSGVVLDSVVPMQGLYFSRSDEEGGAPMKYWAALCDADSFCAGKMGTPAWTKVQSALQKIPQGHCPASGLDKDYSTLLRSLLPYNEFAWAILPVLNRFDRCTDADATFVHSFLERLANYYGGGGPDGNVHRGPDDEDMNDALYMNVAFSELWEVPAPTQAVLRQRYQEALLPSGGIDQLGRLQADWPVYPHDEFVGVYPTTDVPVLTLNGTLDSQTPLDLVKVVETFYTKPHQTFVTMPNANHGVAISYDGEEIPCGSRIMQGFIENPAAAIDSSCTATPRPISLQGDPEFNAAYLGTEDLWEGTIEDAQPLRQISERVRKVAERIEIRRRSLGNSLR